MAGQDYNYYGFLETGDWLGVVGWVGCQGGEGCGGGGGGTVNVRWTERHPPYRFLLLSIVPIFVMLGSLAKCGC